MSDQPSRRITRITQHQTAEWALFQFRRDLFPPSCSVALPPQAQCRERRQPACSCRWCPQQKESWAASLPPGTEHQTQQFLDEALQQPLGGHPSLLVQGRRNKEGIKVRGKTEEGGWEREVRIKGKGEMIRGRDRDGKAERAGAQVRREKKPRKVMLFTDNWGVFIILLYFVTNNTWLAWGRNHGAAVAYLLHPPTSTQNNRRFLECFYGLNLTLVSGVRVSWYTPWLTSIDLCVVLKRNPLLTKNVSCYKKIHCKTFLAAM